MPLGCVVGGCSNLLNIEKSDIPHIIPFDDNNRPMAQMIGRFSETQGSQVRAESCSWTLTQRTKKRQFQCNFDNCLAFMFQ